MTALPGAEVYDDPVFFAGYQRMRAAQTGLNEELEQPALARLLGPVRGHLVELGCGDGALAHQLVEAGADEVVAVDASARMLALAASRPHPRVRYLHADIEHLDLPAGRADHVVASLVLHYVRDYPALISAIAGWLCPGGRFTASMEHPVCTAARPMTGWLTVGPASVGPASVDPATVWPVDHYSDQGPRQQQWHGRRVLKHHRTMATIVGAILAAGLELTGLDEPVPGEDALARRPDLAQHRRRPPLLLVAARKPHQESAVSP
jgi:SAM-dependent methyltransferase